MRIGCGYDVHRLVAGRKLVLGGVDRCPSATLDGAALECSFDAAVREAVVRLPEHAAGKAAKVSIKL